MSTTTEHAAPSGGATIPPHLRVKKLDPGPATVIEWLKPEAPSELEQRCMDLLEPADYEIYNEKLLNILDEAREIFVRSGVTSLLRSGDLILSVYTANGDLANASAGTYLHAVSAVMPVKYVLQEFIDEPSVGIHEGDIFYFNEGTLGGVHNPDQMAFMPVFNDGELIAWTAALVHQPETGANEPGGISGSARSRNDEGLKLSPFKIGENYQIKADLMQVLVNFINRAPRMQAVDTRARVTAADRLRIRMQELAQKKGNDFVRGLLRRLVVEAESASRRRIEQWNDGTYRASIFIDTVGPEAALIRGTMAMTKKGDHITVDLTGSTPETPYSYNAYPHMAAAHAAIYLFAYPFHDLPVSNGTMAPFDWVAPLTSCFNAGADAATSNSVTLCTLIMGLMPTVTAKMIFDSPDRIQIGASIGNSGGCLIFGTVNQYGVPVADLEPSALNTEGQGARSDMDGMAAYGFPWCHAGRSPDTEDSETEYPFIRLFNNLRTDSGGFGQQQGGAATETAIAPWGVPMFFWSSLGKGCNIAHAVGLFGGYPSSASPGISIANTDLREKMARGDRDFPTGAVQLAVERAIGGKYTFEHENRTARVGTDGDVLVQMDSGGAGYGDVLKRDPELVVKDVRRDVISRWTAENLYQVRFARSGRLDEAATVEARAGAKRERIRLGETWGAFHAEWNQLRPAPEAMKYFGSWPDGTPETPIVRI